MTKLNPFPGLRPFEADESHLFFGRETATNDLLQKLQVNRFIAVVGTSGSGKSSLVRAGMLPDLYGGFMAKAGSRWRVAVLRPGDSPIRALAQALAGAEVFGAPEGDGEMQGAITEAVLRRGALGLIDWLGRRSCQPMRTSWSWSISSRSCFDCAIPMRARGSGTNRPPS